MALHHVVPFCDRFWGQGGVRFDDPGGDPLLELGVGVGLGGEGDDPDEDQEGEGGGAQASSSRWGICLGWAV